MASSGYAISRQEKHILFFAEQLPNRFPAPVIVIPVGETPMILPNRSTFPGRISLAFLMYASRSASVGSGWFSFLLLWTSRCFSIHASCSATNRSILSLDSRAGALTTTRQSPVISTASVFRPERTSSYSGRLI